MYNPRIRYTRKDLEVYDKNLKSSKNIIKNDYYREDYIYEQFTGKYKKVYLIDKETKSMTRTKYIKYLLKYYSEKLINLIPLTCILILVWFVIRKY